MIMRSSPQGKVPDAFEWLHSFIDLLFYGVAIGMIGYIVDFGVAFLHHSVYET